MGDLVEAAASLPQPVWGRKPKYLMLVGLNSIYLLTVLEARI